MAEVKKEDDGVFRPSSIATVATKDVGPFILLTEGARCDLSDSSVPTIVLTVVVVAVMILGSYLAAFSLSWQVCISFSLIS